MRHSFLITALVAGALAPLAATAAGAQDRRDRDDYESRIDTLFAFDRRGTVNLVVGSGEIIITAWDRPQVRVRARSERSTLRLDVAPTRMSLDVARTRGGDTELEVTVPVGVRVSARASNGDISIRGTRGGVEATTQSGDITVLDAGDLIDLGSLSGDIVARGLTGNVEARAMNGDMEISDVKGNVEATSVSGDIDLTNIAGRYVRAKSTSGDITFDGTIDATGRYELGSHSGSVYVTVPEATGAMLTVSTYSGSIDSDFPITLRPGEHGIGTSKRFTFEIGKGDARIDAESFSGDITIRSKGRRPSER